MRTLIGLASTTSNMHALDWAIVIALLAVIVTTAVMTRKYTQSVADFLAANRCAGRYLLCISSGMAGLGAISVVAFFEMFYAAGFTADWWMLMLTPLALLIALSGWVIYRYRETRAMTMAQFFEMRYSKGVRVFAGILGWVAGIVNFGIFPAVGARFFIYFCGLPNYPVNIAGMTIDLMFAGVILVLLAISLFFVFLGGQIAVMLTDFIQGVFTNIVFLIILGTIFWMFDWSTIIQSLKSAPPNASMIHPFHTAKVEGFNVFYFLIGAVSLIYGWKAWQGSQGYNCSARTAHEAKMAGILGEWRGLVFTLVAMFLPIGAYVVMNHGGYLEVAQEARAVLDGIDNEKVRNQMTVPVVLAKSLPIGVVGLLCGAMLTAFISTHDTYLHAWGSMFIQDVVLPFRKKPFTPKQHMMLLRVSILFVAVFIFFFSLLFQQNDFIFMFFAITGAIYIGGAGSLILGGLYWKRGSTGGAWVAMITGCSVAIGGMLLRRYWPDPIYPWMQNDAPWLLNSLRTVVEGISSNVWGINWKVEPEAFPLDGQWVNFFAMVLAFMGYVLCSLFSWLILKRPAYNLDKLLHRGRYAIYDDHEQSVTQPVSGLRAILPTEEFTRSDRWIYYGKLLWTIGWFAVFIFGTAAYLGSKFDLWGDLTTDSWVTFWAWRVGVVVAVGIITTIWFTIGGIMDAKAMFQRLSQLKRDHEDVGLVVDDHDYSEDLPILEQTDNPTQPKNVDASKNEA